MVPTVVLKKTRARPIPIFEVPKGGIVKYKYLYTDTGKATSWTIALNLAFEKGVEPPKEIILRIEHGGGSNGA